MVSESKPGLLNKILALEFSCLESMTIEGESPVYFSEYFMKKSKSIYVLIDLIQGDHPLSLNMTK